MFFADSDWAQLVDSAQQSTIAGRERDGFWTAASNAFSDSLRTQNVVAQRLNETEAWDDEVQRFQKETGRVIGYPRAPAPGRGPQYAVPYGQFRADVDAWNEANPDRSFLLPAADEMQRRAVARYRRARTDREVSAEPGQSWGNWFGEQAGGLGSMAIDAPNIVAFSLLAAPHGTAVLRAAIGDAFAGAVGQAGNAGLTYDYRQQMDRNYGLGEAAKETAEAGLMGGVGGAVLRGAAAGVKRAASPVLRQWREWRSRPDLDRETVDAGNVVDHAENASAANPFPDAGAAGATAHADAMAEAYRAAAAGEVPKFSPAIEEVRAAQARAQRLAEAGPMPDAGLTPERIARTRNQDLFSTADRLDTDIAQARAQIAEITGRTHAEPPPGVGAVRVAEAEKQIAAIEQELATFTGKRRSSPAANEARERLATAKQELAAAQDAPRALAEAQATRDADRVTVLRQRIIELRNERAGIGPMINEAISDATRRLEARLENEAGRIRNAIAEGRAPRGTDITADLATARDLVTARADITPLDFADGVTPRVRAFVALMHEDETLTKLATPEEITRRVEALADAVAGRKGAAGTAPEPSAGMEVPGREEPAGAPLDAAAAARMAEAVDPETVIRDTASPEAHDAAIMDAMRLIDQKGDIEIRVPDADGNLVKRKLSDIMAEADDEIAAAKELHGCAVGKVPEA